MKKFFIQVLILFAVIFSLVFLNPQKTFSFWRYKCIDTMKESRDRAGDWPEKPDVKELIFKELTLVKELGANCAAVATPYDEEFVPFLKEWTQQAHELDLAVWFRGNFSGWEGWFDYPKFSDEGQHHKLTYEFISTYPELFASGDIFTPAPEPENGMIGDPRGTGENERFLKFLVDSYDNCLAAFTKINKQVHCGYFSTNGDIAAQILNRQTVEKLGNIVVIDHYVDDSGRFERDIKSLHETLNAQIAVGEFGAPIPDIHGQMSEQDQARFVQKLFEKLYIHKDIIQAVNYWVLSGGTTAIIDEDGSWRKAAYVVRNYFKPATIIGHVQNSLGEFLGSTRIVVGDAVTQSTTDATGKFSAIIPGGSHRITVENESYKTVTQIFDIPAGDTVSLKVTLQPKDASLLYRLRKILQVFLSRFSPKVSL